MMPDHPLGPAQNALRLGPRQGMVTKMTNKIMGLIGPLPSPAPMIINTLKNRRKTVSHGSIGDFTPQNYYTMRAPQLS